MTEPPDEPTPDEPDEQPSAPGWQAPGPPPGPPDPVHGRNPYGGETTSYYQPVDSGGMSSTVKVVLGVVIGVFGGFVLWIVAAVSFAAGQTGDEDTFLLFAALAPLVVPAPLLFWRATRPWAVGLLIGTAISSIGLSSLCSAMISSF